MQQRINKFLAQNNIAARRKADDLITKGKVKINGKVAQLGAIVDTETDTVSVGGLVIRPKNIGEANYEYILLNKPERVLSAVTDDRNRLTVTQFVNSANNLFPVGRLDSMSTGLILLTNDGDLSYKMTHPKFHIPKTYVVKTKETLKQHQMDKIKKGGIPIEENFTSEAHINVIGRNTFEITIYEGLKRQIRVSCEHVGLTVVSLKRVSIGELELGNLKEGEYRNLTDEEFQYIQHIKDISNSF